jgi:hypothetical protein
LEAIEEARLVGPKAFSESRSRTQQTTASEIIESVTEEKADGPVNDQRLQDLVSDYEVCDNLRVNTHGELHEASLSRLANAVAAVVSVEGPIHTDEVVRRVRTLWGLRRTGDRIRKAVNRGISYATKQKLVRNQQQFLWPPQDRILKPRRRTGEPPPRIELICEEEIAKAIKLVLEHQFATSKEDLIIQASRILGIQATRGSVSKRINDVIGLLLNQETVKILPNGMVDLAKRTNT